MWLMILFFFSSRRRHTRFDCDWSSDVCSSDLLRPLPLNGTVLIEGLAGGDHSLGFSGAATNCPVAGANPRTVHVTTSGTTRDTARTTFDVTCVAVTGTVQVTTTDSGLDPDPNGFSAL